jgi:Family of unknown function (DUF5362)
MDYLKDNDLLDLQVTDDTKIQLTEVSKWANIYAIVAFIGLGVSIISGFLAMGASSRYGGGSAAASGLVGIIFVGAITLLLNITLYNAAKNIKAGIDTSDQGFFNLGMAKLKTYFKITGILLIIALGFFILFFLFAIIAGSAGVFR